MSKASDVRQLVLLIIILEGIIHVLRGVQGIAAPVKVRVTLPILRDLPERVVDALPGTRTPRSARVLIVLVLIR